MVRILLLVSDSWFNKLVGRPRKISDEDLVAACGRAIGQYGAGFTLAQVAAEAGSRSPGGSGSKQGLLVAMMTASAVGVERRPPRTPTWSTPSRVRVCGSLLAAAARRAGRAASVDLGAVPGEWRQAR